jgi:hypothetical protein
MNFKKTLLTACFSLSVLSCAAYFLYGMEKKISSSFDENNPLYIIHARSARIEMSTSTRGNLFLKSVGESVAFFANFNERKGGTTAIENFVADWTEDSKRFEINPPIGALVYFSTDVKNFGRRHYSELTILVRGMHLYATHDILEVEFEVINQEDEIYTGRLLEPTLFLE